MAIGNVVAQRVVGSEDRSRHRLLQCWDQRMREGRSVAAGVVAPWRGDAEKIRAGCHLLWNRTAHKFST
eukprot:3610485-Pyramimonas_sp.AAC.1